MMLSKFIEPFGYRLTKAQKKGNGASVLVVTMPKSGSLFLAKTLKRTLDLKRIHVSPGYFPIDHADIRSMAQLSMGGFVAQSHLSACEINLNILSHYCDKWILHLRDPRAALLSWTHHKERTDVSGQPETNLRTVPLEPPVYFSMSFSEKIDWQIDHHVPNLIRWIETWCKALDSITYRDRIIVSKYEDMVGRDEAFMHELLIDLGREIPASIELAQKDMRSHFRNGAVDEWRAAFTPVQIERVAEMIPHHLMERFGWDKV
ncbi:hypothetical protein G5V57_28770 [Nordella sp. HKS 07]|uniref:sulfotransferase domain-containing protein n=1 Tax=Nordella sp. HKS 07 TaxID=2712222 RepID=UPI0013E1DB92|nr:sulfotransferase domain-containing protein [Nordella sp. HKS 07]QIG51356.1 hypothetical protein G5V57_28770 [Nordella sp. HKS 07]